MSTSLWTWPEVLKMLVVMVDGVIIYFIVQDNFPQMVIAIFYSDYVRVCSFVHSCSLHSDSFILK